MQTSAPLIQQYYLLSKVAYDSVLNQERAILANWTFLMTKKKKKKYCAEKTILHLLSQIPAIWKSKVRKCRLEVFLLPSSYHVQSICLLHLTHNWGLCESKFCCDYLKIKHILDSSNTFLSCVYFFCTILKWQFKISSNFVPKPRLEVVKVL